jgi:hypothetical protein
MNKKVYFGALLALTLPSMLGLIAYASLGSLSRFIADDYCVAYFAQHFGLLRSIWYWYITWSGSYSTSVMDWLLVFIKPGGIPFVTPVILFIWLVATIAAVALLQPRDASIKQSAVVAFTLGPLTVYIVLLISPDVPQSLYWWTGMRAYIMPLIISTLYVALYRLFKYRGKQSNIMYWSMISFGLIFLNGGFSETFTPVQVVIFASILLLGLLGRKMKFRDPSFYFFAAGFLGALASLLVMVAAPGNTNRQVYFQSPPDILDVLRISVSAFFAFLLKIVSTPEKILGLLGAWFGTFWLGMEMRPKLAIKSWTPLIFGLAAFVLAFGCFIPAAWGLSDAPPDRNIIIPAFLLVSCSLAAFFATGNLVSDRIKLKFMNVAAFGTFLTTLTLITISVVIEIWSLYNARPAYLSYAEKWDTVNQQIITAKGSGYDVVHIPNMDSWTSLNIPNDNPRFWVNICFSNYYDIKVLSP